MLFRTVIRVNALACVLLMSGGFFFGAAHAQDDAQRIDGIVAIVGTQPILQSDVEAMAMSIARGARPTLELRRSALEELIMHNVLAERAMRDTLIVIREDEVSAALDERSRQIVQQVGSEAAVADLYGRSLAQLREDHRSEVRRQLAAQALQRRFFQTVQITPREVRDWFEEIPTDSLPEIPELVRIAHVVQFPEIEADARESARARMEAIRDSIEAGAATIEEMARRHTDDPGSRDTGGRYSAINVHDLVPEFGAIAATLSPGELSHVFETQFGYHILRLNDLRGDLLDFNHILISIDHTRTDPTSAIATLEMVRDSVVNGGASFARIAREFSEDPESATRGGNVVVPQSGERDLRLEALSAEWRSTISALEEGEISEPRPVTLLDGRPAYHIVLLQRHVPAHRMSLETDWTLAESFALQYKRQRVFEEWITELRSEVYVSCKDEVLCPPGSNRTAVRR